MYGRSTTKSKAKSLAELDHVSSFSTSLRTVTTEKNFLVSKKLERVKLFSVGKVI